MAARYQLQCIARVARGTYSDVTGAADLGARLGAVVTAKPPATKTAMTIARPKPGRLQIRNPDLFGHTVTEAESGKEVAKLSNTRALVELSAGLYNVTFGPTVWKSVEVIGGETTVLDPGVLEVNNASLRGHKVLDWETGLELGTVSMTKRRLSVLPSTFTVTFGGAEWRNIEVTAGEHKILNPAVIAVKGADVRGHRVSTADGTLVATMSATASVLPVPPGQYVIEVGGQRVPLELAEGQRMEINRQ